MRWTIDKISAFIAVLCRIFAVPLANMDDGGRGNAPPASGGISSLGH